MKVSKIKLTSDIYSTDRIPQYVRNNDIGAVDPINLFSKYCKWACAHVKALENNNVGETKAYNTTYASVNFVMAHIRTKLGNRFGSQYSFRVGSFLEFDQCRRSGHVNKAITIKA